MLVPAGNSGERSLAPSHEARRRSGRDGEASSARSAGAGGRAEVESDRDEAWPLQLA